MERWKIFHSAKNLEQKRRNVKRSADVSGNARHFCDCELNYTGCEEKRLEAMTVRRLAARDLEQVVRTNLERLEPLLFRTQLH